MDAIAARLGPEIDDRKAGSRSRRQEDLVGIGQAHAHGIDQDISIIARVKLGFAADRGNTNAVAIAANAADHARHQTAGLGVGRLTKAQGIEQGNGTRAHRKDVAHDAANTRRCALIGLDIGGVVVRLHLEDRRLTVTDVDHTGIFARTDQNARPSDRKLAQVTA